MITFVEELDESRGLLKYIVAHIVGLTNQLDILFKWIQLVWYHGCHGCNLYIIISETVHAMPISVIIVDTHGGPVDN